MTGKRIMVDGYNLSLEKGTGIATYARNLTYNLHALGHQVEMLYGYNLPPPKFAQAREMSFFDPPDIQFKPWTRRLTNLLGFLGGWRDRRAFPVPTTGLVVDDGLKARLPYYDRLYNSDNLFANADSKHRVTGRNERVIVEGGPPDIMHWTFPVPAELVGAKNIYTIHDIVPMRLPFTTLDSNRHFAAMMDKIVAHADHIVTVSETSRRDIINFLGVPEDRVTNTYQAVDIPQQYANKPREVVAGEVRGVFGVDYKRYYLFFGALEPKKNVGRLIEAYLGANLEDPLVIVGSKAWRWDVELRLLFDDKVRTLVHVEEEHFVHRRVRRFDYAPFPLLISLVKGAKAVVAPSLYEGFGLPALEAMSLGTPVITSNQGASPEIVGDGALQVDPYKPAEIREALAAIDSDSELAGDLSRRGIRRAEAFSNEAYRKRLEELYAKL